MKASRSKYFIVKQDTVRTKIGQRTVYVTTDEREAKAVQDKLNGLAGFATYLSSVER